MVRRPALRFAALLAALALLLPLAAGAACCESCLWGAASPASPASPACCPPSCCPCCVSGPSILAASAWDAPHSAPVDRVAQPRPDRHPSSPPGDIFHVPKPALP